VRSDGRARAIALKKKWKKKTFSTVRRTNVHLFVSVGAFAMCRTATLSDETDSLRQTSPKGAAVVEYVASR